MLNETKATLKCLSEGKVGHCPEGGMFPLLQKIPTAIGLQLGMTDDAIVEFLIYVNMLATFLLLYFGGKSLASRSVFRRNWYWALIVLSPFLWYARTSFSETLGAALIFATVLLCSNQNTLRWGALVLVIAGLSKETAWPFLILLSLAAQLVGEKSATLKSIRYIEIILAGLLSLGLHTLYNYFRFGGPLNEGYLNPMFIVPSLGIHLSFLTGLFFSGNGGIAWFCPLFLPLSIVALVRLKEGVAKNAAAILTLASFMALAVGMARWYAPFGWIAWGPRLLMPWIPAAAWLLLQSFPIEWDAAFLQSIKSTRLFLPLCLILAFFLFPQVAVIFRNELIWIPFANDATCPNPTIIQRDIPYYYRCLNYYIWGKTPILLIAFEGWNLLSLSFWLTFSGWMGLILIFFRLRKAE